MTSQTTTLTGNGLSVDAHAAEQTGACVGTQQTLRAQLILAKVAPGRYKLSTQGCTQLDPSRSDTSAKVRDVFKNSLFEGVRDAASLARHSGNGTRLQTLMKMMASECGEFIDAFAVDDEDSLTALSRACMETLQGFHIFNSAVGVARIEMTKIIWQAQSSARACLGTQRAYKHRRAIA